LYFHTSDRWGIIDNFQSCVGLVMHFLPKLTENSNKGDKLEVLDSLKELSLFKVWQDDCKSGVNLNGIRYGFP
jgi:hypothetical protein